MTPTARRKALAKARQKLAHATFFETEAAMRKAKAALDRLLKAKPKRKATRS